MFSNSKSNNYFIIIITTNNYYKDSYELMLTMWKPNKENKNKYNYVINIKIYQ